MARRPQVVVSALLSLVLAVTLFTPAHHAVVLPALIGIVGDEATGSGIAAIAPERPTAPPDQPLGRAPDASILAPSAVRRTRPAGRGTARRTARAGDTVSLRAPPGPGRATAP
ncbi:MAG: hypothetical protein AB7J32_25050 [Pseudonocardia sp.]